MWMLISRTKLIRYSGMIAHNLKQFLENVLKKWIWLSYQANFAAEWAQGRFSTESEKKLLS